MSLLYWDGFDHYPTTDTDDHGIKTAYYHDNLGGYTDDLVTGRFGGKALQLPTLGSIPRGFFFPVPGGGKSTLLMGLAFHTASLASLSTDMALISFSTDMSYTDQQVTMTIGADRLVRVYRGNKSALLGTSAAQIAENAWQYIEFGAFIDDATGSFEVKLDGTSILSGSGVDTKQSASTNLCTVAFFGSGHSGSGRGVLKLDDMYLKDDLTFLGPCRVETLYPTSDTADKDWARSSGADNYALIDDAGTLSDYIQSSAANDFDLYNLADISSIPLHIWGVAPVALASKTEAGDSFLTQAIKVGAGTYDGEALGVAVGNEWHRHQWLVSPSTSNEWTRNQINGMRAGLKRT